MKQKIFEQQAWYDYLYWQQQDKKLLKRIHLLIKDIERNPYQGIGKPEALKHDLAGWWSHRINDEHRMVYKVQDGKLFLASLRYHYR